MFLRTAEARCDEHRSDLVAVQARGVRLVVEPRSPDVHRRRDRDEALLLGVPVEARDRAQPSSDRRTGATERLEMAAEALDIRPARTE